MSKKTLTSRGSASRVLLILAAVIIFFTVAVYFLIKYAQTKKEAVSPKEGEATTQNEPPKPVYDVMIGDIKFLLQSSKNLGSILKGNAYQTDLTTTEYLIWVKVGAQNKGKVNIDRYSWDLGNLVDSEGRNFTPITNKAFFWLPKPDLCGEELKPEFEPISCVRIYEVSRESKGLKVEVISRIKNASKKQSELLDLDLVQ